VSDPRRRSLGHTLDLGVLLVVVGALFAGAMLVEAAETLVRRQYEPESWASGRCENSAEFDSCHSRELAKTEIGALVPSLRQALIGALMIAGGIVLLGRRPSVRGRRVESSEDGSA
jgi:hypothetical protein